MTEPTPVNQPPGEQEQLKLYTALHNLADLHRGDFNLVALLDGLTDLGVADEIWDRAFTEINLLIATRGKQVTMMVGE